MCRPDRSTNRTEAEQMATQNAPGRSGRWCEHWHDDVDGAQAQARHRQNECKQEACRREVARQNAHHGETG